MKWRLVYLSRLSRLAGTSRQLTGEQGRVNGLMSEENQVRALLLCGYRVDPCLLRGQGRVDR